MRLIRVDFVRTAPLGCRTITRASSIRGPPSLRSTFVRWYNAHATSSIPPPEPSETTSQSSGLNPQLHPEGRPPISTKPRLASAAANSSPKNDSKVTSASIADSTNPALYRTPLRTTSSSAPVTARDTVKLLYEGPLRKTVRGLKAFSISSLILSTSMTPFILTMEAPLPMIARVAMISTGLCLNVHADIQLWEQVSFPQV